MSREGRSACKKNPTASTTLHTCLHQLCSGTCISIKPIISYTEEASEVLIASNPHGENTARGEVLPCWDTMVTSSPLSISILLGSRNQVIFGNGMDLAQHETFAMSPRISGPVDWGSSMMLTKAAEDVRVYSGLIYTQLLNVFMFCCRAE